MLQPMDRFRARLKHTTYNMIMHGDNPGLWLRFNEQSGITAINRGSVAGADGTYSAVTLAQPGKVSGNHAILSDGINSIVSIPFVAALANLTSFEYALLHKPASAGESSKGVFFVWGAGTTEPFARFNSALTMIGKVANTNPSNFQTTTTTTLTTGVWQWLFISYDDTGDRKIHFFVGKNKAVTECSYSAQPALTGTFSKATSTLYLLNTASLGFTYDGLVDESYYGAPLTPADRLRLVKRLNV